MNSGNLWDKIKKVSERATQIGSIEKIESTPVFIKENGINFRVSVAKSLLKRPFNFPKPDNNIDNNNNNNCNINNSNNNIETSSSTTTTTTITSTTSTTTTTTTTKKFIDPFLPCDKDLFVQELFDKHNLVLNKYNVSNHHSIIATKEFESQLNPLNEFDFKAIWKCIKECDMLCFFNCGPNSGASQPHKHVQLLPTPFDAEDEPNLKCPIESVLLKYKDEIPNETIFQIDQLPFKTAALYFNQLKLNQFDENSNELSKYLELKYLSLLNHLNLNENKDESSNNNKGDYNSSILNENEKICKLKSYNFIMTKDWMFIVPRSNYQSKGISINSVGFTGAVLVRKDEEFEIIKNHGITNILYEVSFPK